MTPSLIALSVPLAAAILAGFGVRAGVPILLAAAVIAGVGVL